MALSEHVRQLTPVGFVNDYANVLDTESTRQIQFLCSQVDSRAQAQIAVVTVQSLEGSTIESFATRLFRQWGIGPKSNDRGVLVLLPSGTTNIESRLVPGCSRSSRTVRPPVLDEKLFLTLSSPNTAARSKSSHAA